jgi:hypothetical protein
LAAALLAAPSSKAAEFAPINVGEGVTYPLPPVPLPAMQAMPEQMNILSSVIKYFVPTTLENTIRNLAVLLGARHFLREGDYFGIFQKILRDSAIASVFEFSTVINLDIIVHSIGKLVRLETSAEDRDRLASAFCLSKDLPPFAFESLKASSHARNDVFHGLERAVDLLGKTAKQRSIDPLARDQLPLLGARLLEEARRLRDSVENVLETDSGRLTSPELFELAKRYCALHAASACLRWARALRARGDAWLQRPPFSASAPIAAPLTAGATPRGCAQAGRRRCRNSELVSAPSWRRACVRRCAATPATHPVLEA